MTVLRAPITESLVPSARWPRWPGLKPRLNQSPPPRKIPSSVAASPAAAGRAAPAVNQPLPNVASPSSAAEGAPIAPEQTYAQSPTLNETVSVIASYAEVAAYISTALAIAGGVDTNGTGTARDKVLRQFRCASEYDNCQFNYSASLVTFNFDEVLCQLDPRRTDFQRCPACPIVPSQWVAGSWMELSWNRRWRFTSCESWIRS